MTTMVVETLQTALAPLEPWLGRALSERQLQIVLTSFTVLNILYPIVAWMSARFVPQYKVSETLEKSRISMYHVTQKPTN